MPIYLDTHIVIWLAGGESSRLSEPVRQLIRNSDLLISPTVALELQVLHEIGRITDDVATVLGDLERSLDLKVCSRSFTSVVEHAVGVSWTRDPFDRLIVGQAAAGSNILITKDVLIRKN